MSKKDSTSAIAVVNKKGKMLFQTAAKIVSLKKSLLLSNTVIQVIALNVFTKKTLKIL